MTQNENTKCQTATVALFVLKVMQSAHRVHETCLSLKLPLSQQSAVRPNILEHSQSCIDGATAVKIVWKKHDTDFCHMTLSHGFRKSCDKFVTWFYHTILIGPFDLAVRIQSMLFWTVMRFASNRQMLPFKSCDEIRWIVRFKRSNASVQIMW